MAKGFDASKMQVFVTKKSKIDDKHKAVVQVYSYNKGDVKVGILCVDEKDNHRPMHSMSLEAATKVARLIRKAVDEYNEEHA